MKEILIKDKLFRVLISGRRISRRIDDIAAMINRDFEGREVIFIGILNGAFMFAADLFKRINLKARISFVKLSSYHGTSSTGSIRELIGLNEELENKSVIILEDIIDSGETLEWIVNDLSGRKTAEIRVAALLLKPEAYSGKIPVDYIGFKIPRDFVVGYGLDYDGFGRNLPSVYSLVVK